MLSKRKCSLVRFARVLRDVSQAQLAQKTGLSQATISKLELGRANETPRIAAAKETIAHALNFPLDCLFPDNKEAE